MQTLFFWVSKLGWYIISPFNFIFILLIAVWMFLFFKKQRSGYILLSCIIIFLILIAFIPIGKILIAPLEKRFETNPDLPKTVGGIIVLCGSMDPILSNLWNQEEIHGSVERELSFISLAKIYPEAKLIYTGGSSSFLHQELKEADIAKYFFLNQGIDVSRIVFERNARNTYENAILSMNRTHVDTNKPWILITSAYHMPRSVGIFCKLGWNIIPYPVDHRTRPQGNIIFDYNLAGHMSNLGLAIHEWLGLVIYYFTGKSSDIFPGSCSKNSS